jgi:hypothetical protein
MSHAQILLDRTGAPDNLWFLAQDYMSNVHNLSANRQLNWKILEQVSRGGQTYPISRCFIVLNLYCIRIQSQNFNYQKPQIGLDNFVGFADNLGDALRFKILKNDLVTVLHRSVVRSAADPNHRNRRVSFKSDVQESLKLLDNRPSLSFAWKDSHHKHKSRN